MKAAIYTEYGSPDVIHFVELEKPVPKDDEVLVEVRAASINPLDWRLMRGEPAIARFMLGGFRRPRPTRPGVDVAGQVEAVGKGVRDIKPGDSVFGACRGALAEYVCGTQDKLVLKPLNCSFESAAALPVAAISALQGLRDKGRIQRGQRVLIDGASGGVGTYAIQIAKFFGAEVTAVCSTRNVELARSLGADHVIDYTGENFTQSGQRYELILAANAHRSIFDYRRALERNGTLVLVGGGWPEMLQVMLLGPLLSTFGRKKYRFFIAKLNKVDLLRLKDMLEANQIAPVIDRRYPLDDVAAALRYLEQGHAQGKVVITVGTSNQS